MERFAEFEIEVSEGRITEAQVMPDGSCTTIEDTTCYQQKGIFKKVAASELRLLDTFMAHIPRTRTERNFKKQVKTAIKKGLKDFWCPIYAPSFDDNHRICYEPGKMIAVGKSYDWWEENAKKYAPERGSRLGTKTEYIAFFAVLIKELVALGWPVACAWSEVCCRTQGFGYCVDYELTGWMGLCGWYDLEKCYRILADDEETGWFWIAGGNRWCGSKSFPLVDLLRCNFRYGCKHDSCGWLVLTKGSTNR